MCITTILFLIENRVNTLFYIMKNFVRLNKAKIS